MLKVALAYFIKNQRLHLATAGAVLSHIFLFGTGFLVIDQFLIPSDINRILVLSLEMETEDGESNADLLQANTLNTNNLGEASSIVSQTMPSQKVAAPNYQDSDKLSNNPMEPDVDPDPTQPSSSNNSTAQAFSEVATPPIEIQSTADSTQSPSVDETKLEVENSSMVAEQSMLSSSDSSVRILTNNSSVQTAILGKKLEFSNTQKKMLNRKIRHWTENMEDFSDSSDPISWKHKGQTYIASFSRLPAAGDMDMDKVIVEIITEQHGKELKKELRMKKLAFSNFAQFTHLWDDNVTIHDDVLDGRFHSNSTISIASDHKAAPIFNGRVTTASYQVDIDAIGSRGHKKNIFLGGLQTRVKKILMPKPNLLFSDKLDGLIDNEFNRTDKASTPNTLVLDKDSKISFHADGRVSWQELKNDHRKKFKEKEHTDIEIQSRLIGEQPFYIIAKPSVILSVSGTINGKVLLYSPKRVIIDGNLLYSNRGDIALGGDFLGIVSGRNVVIASDQITGPGDLQIDASIYAKGQFKVTNYRSKGSATLHLFGSVSAMSMGATEPRFATNIVFDRRLENARPPGFPVTNRYEIASIDKDWKENGWLEKKAQVPTTEPGAPLTDKF